MWIRTLIGCFAFAQLLNRVESQNLTLLGESFPKCTNLAYLGNNFFHAVTCSGYIRVAMRGEDYDSMNAKIDGIIANAKKTFCLKYGIRVFYYSETQLVFLRYPKMHKHDWYYDRKDPDRNMLYWVANVSAGEVDQLVPFPDWSEWKLARAGYSPNEYEELLDSNQKEAKDCQAIAEFELRPLEHWACLSDAWMAKEITKTVDPVHHLVRYLAGHSTYHEYYYADGTFTKEDVANVQTYAGVSFHTRRRNFIDKQYYLLLEARLFPKISNGADREEKIKLFYASKHGQCYLRKFRQELGELPVPYVLPATKSAKIYDETLRSERDETDQPDFSPSIYLNFGLLMAVLICM